MDEKEQQAIELVINSLDNTISELTHEKTELEICISEVKNARDALIRQLPPEKRIERLFH